MRALLAALVVALVASGCGASGVKPADDVVAAAQESLERREAGRIEFELTASAQDGEPVGFAVRGVYEFGEADLAVVDLTYEIDSGDESVEYRILSDGKAAVVVADDEVLEVPSELARSLRVQSGAAAGVPTLALASWVRDAEVCSEGGRTEVRGEVRAAAFIADLQRTAASVGGSAVGDISGDDANRLERAVTDSEITLVAESNANELRSLNATVDFGARVPPELRKALGTYAGARLALTVEVDDVDTPLDIELPE